LSGRARLVSSILVAIAGGALATVGSRATWFIVRERSAAVSVPGQGTFRFPARAVHLGGSELSGAIIGIALLILICAALGLLVGPRARAFLLIAVVAGSGLVIWLSMGVSRTDAINAARQTKQFSAAAPEVQKKSGGGLTIAGAALSGVGAIAGLFFGKSVVRVRMPERGPEET
jgi:hypothetical protein